MNQLYTFRVESLLHANQSAVFKAEASSEQEAAYDVKRNVKRWMDRKGLRERDVSVSLVGVRRV